jgi:ubiquinone/menaquinone biosynthesis C-methylase UbiE
VSSPATAAWPFDVVAQRYDADFTNTAIGRAQRRQVLRIADGIFQPGQRILELNCGTGVDAAHFAERGIEVLGTDASGEMVAIARERCGNLKNARFQVCAIEQLAGLRGRFDGVFSNFSGINCISDLESLGEQLARLVRPDGVAVLCLFGSFCPWETGWYLSRLQFQKAFRRMLGKSRAQVASQTVNVRYWRTKEVRRALMPWFDLSKREGVGILVPPSYVEGAARRWPRVLRALEAADEKLSAAPLLGACADHVVLTFRRTNVKG